ncbi:helix-turn-helix transcriptional regulator [Streptomyces liliifuscus]|uniref:HTH luxR-type domain-containing protein n=1 Tax=Streptomyces liliifuscus TaxID=2797636 RepID=A0A7T7L1Y4_9ACTN|nr:LuxR C-terminal-related transcriptional regulator [Streptomyces liliifuscus]QQM44976.1 hypothetical protein JEQ17_39965 [Streptomyces liliifuscus]
MSAPLPADVLEQIRTAGLVLPRPPHPGQQWKARTDAETHLLREGYRLDRVRQLLLGELGRLHRVRAEEAARRKRTADAMPPLCPLSQADLAALKSAAAGESSTDTSRRLLMPYDTVRAQRKRAMSRLGARTVTQAVGLAVAAGWITGEEIAGGVTP